MPLAKVLVPLVAAASASGQGLPFDARGYPSLELSLRVSALDPGATVAAQVEHSEDALDWEPLGAPLQGAELGKRRSRVTGAYRYVRLTYAVTGGVASLTFAGKALQVYASPADLHRLGIQAPALVALSEEEQDKGLGAGSDFAASYLRGAPGIDLPLATWGDDLRRVVCMIAAYDLRSAGGYQPTKDEENSLRQRYKDALAWLQDIRAGNASLVDPDDPAGEVPNEGLPEVYSDAPWGF